MRNTGQQVFADIRPVAGVDLNMGVLFEQGVTGKGVVVGVMEPGSIDPLQEDLMANLVLKDGGGAAPQSQADAHTTAVAGIIAAVALNGKGGRGVAPGAKLLDMQAPGVHTQPVPRVINNSEGMPTAGYMPFAMDGADADFDMLTKPTLPLIIKAAGNGYIENGGRSIAECTAATRASGAGCMPANAEAFNALPGVLVVGAVNAAGRNASYASTGSVLWVAAPGGESGHQRAYALKAGALPEKAARLPEAFFAPAVTSTDVMGCDKGVNKDGVAVNALDFGSRSPVDKSCNYMAVMTGTSAAAPMVSGVIAMMLQVNPSLGWREIKYILATTARKIQPLEAGIRWNDFTVDGGWVTNAAGRAFSNRYGFGLVDASAAVDLARRFKPLPALVQPRWHNYDGPPVAIPYRSDDAGFAAITVEDDLTIETVQLRVKTTHRTPGNVRIMLVWPSGTRSIIAPALSASSLLGDEFDIGLTASNAFLDERSKGTWKLQVVDAVDPSSATSSALRSWQILVLGTRAN
ncbi:S8 family serine peptidase [Paraburkholderia sp.]|uniref:S8 family serine peptidase n=1 Tax=Paraburkholderia sp. TaxID=1926495 RepID=UPI00238A4426|nr:S8 family serine peptidase [Paraburkholderia sp.]MDE1181958.1 S8 family serine peptidase [Paraburkholderia sp.]